MNTADDPSPTPDAPRCPQCGARLVAGALAGLCPACLLRQGATDDSVTGAPRRPFEPPTVEEIAALFPQLEVLEFIGKGGMGAVYKARQKELDRVVALKILPAALGDAPGFAERFAREAKALAKLNHPGIVTIHEFGRADRLFYIVMEFVDGVNLRDLISRGRVSSREALAIVPAICDALQFAHDHGIVHRDIKPANVLIDRRGRVKVADFGLAKLVEDGVEAAAAEQSASGDAALTEAGKVMGTPSYMAPEQKLRPDEVDHRADIYALGVVFYELLTGELPGARLQPPSRKVHIDVRLDEIVLRALENEPALRFQKASEVKTAVENVSSNAPIASPAPSPGRPEAVAAEIPARDYAPDIGQCLQRAWGLVRSDFWPLVGVTALFVVLLGLVGSAAGAVQNPNHQHSVPGAGILYLLLKGPLVGGLQLYFLHKIRGHPVSIETAFSGFSPRFLHLFLAGLVTTTLTTLGFFCFIIPGIYLTVAWTFTLALVIDKNLHFWSAMELSRKSVSKHWWKFFLFALVLAALKLAGLLVFIIGFFVALPIAIAALMFTYEEMFAAEAVPASAPPIVLSDTVRRWGWPVGVAIALLLLFSSVLAWKSQRSDHEVRRARAVAARVAPPAQPAAKASAVSWLQGEWVFDAEHFKEQARLAAAATTDDRQKAILQALTTATFEGSEGMTWTITATEMQSHHPGSGTRKGPYRIVRKRDADTVEVEVMDEGKPKRMIFHREGEHLRLSMANRDPKNLIDLPAYYKKVTPTLLER